MKLWPVLSVCCSNQIHRMIERIEQDGKDQNAAYKQWIYI